MDAAVLSATSAVERVNGRISSEMLDINVHSHRAVEPLRRGLHQAYNARYRRVPG